MYLKRLEIQGFKSLADKIELNFNPGVAGVVGPNGSGKSNISDAIRWVLGEQSAKTLRGAKMEDIIFSGSEKRRPVGMAEVSLTIDNTSGRFPLDFSEVTVTRRVFRSGESEYLINKTPCRLRDIHELFMDTGVGREGYSIIGQGKIDEILNAKAEDRRQLIEEAAGIVKYKNRKLHAARKLADTEQNLLRISDIIGELSAQVGPLQEQAATAEQYLDFKEELSKLEINLFVHQLEEVGGKLDEILTETNEKKQTALSAETELRVAESKAEELKLKINKLDEEITEVQQAVFDLSNAVEKNEAAVKVAEERRRGLNRDKERLTAELAEIRQRIETVKNQHAGEVTALNELRGKIAIGQNDLAEKEVRLTEVETSLGNDETGIETGKGDIIESMNEMAAVRNELGNLEVSEKNHEKRIGQLTNERADAEEQAAGIKNALALAEIEYKNLKQGITKAEDDLNRHNNQQEVQETQLAAIRSSISDNLRLLGSRESRLKVLEEMQQDYEGYYRGVREVLKAGKTGKLKGICGVVGELLQVPEEYATAVEVALGGAVQFIIVETDRDAQQAIEFLKAGKAGRATFLPLNTIRAGEPDKSLQKVINSKDCLGTAAELVKIDERFNNILRFLLGRIAVLKNLDRARESAKESGYRHKLVTLDGDIINPGGSFTGGSQSKNNTGLLGRAAEIEKLQKEMQQLLKLRNKLSIDENKMLEDLRKTQENAAANRKIIQEKQVLLTGAGKDLEQQKNEQERNERLIQAADMEMEQEKDEIAQLNGKREVLNKQLAQLERNNQELKQSIDLMQEKLKNNQELKDLVNSEITATRVQLAALEQEAAGYEQLLARANSSVEELKAQVRSKEKELDGIGTTEAFTDQEIEGLKEQRVKQMQEKGEAEDRLNRARGERHSDIAALNEMESMNKQALKQIGQLQEQIHSLDVRRARLEMEMENARQRLMEEHELTFEEAVLMKTEIKNRREVTSRIKELKGLIAELGTVNLGAIEEYARVKERYEFLTVQHNDLEEAKLSLYKVIEEMDEIMTRRFREAFQTINTNFCETFTELFGGGKADLQLTDSTNLLETGIEIVAQPPGKKPQHLSLLSGGERALTAIALLFAILMAKPSPFCVLDEIEAALDEANVDRFARYLKEFARDTQFIVVTHRKGTMEVADVLYGVTMDESGVTKLVSMRLADAADKVS